MPGPIELDETIIRPMTDLAYQDSNGNWHAGPDAVSNGKAENIGEFVSESYAQKARKQRQHMNAVKQNMRKQDMTEKQARNWVNNKLDELKEERDKDEPDKERIDVIQRQLGGSP